MKANANNCKDIVNIVDIQVEEERQTQYNSCKPRCSSGHFAFLIQNSKPWTKRKVRSAVKTDNKRYCKN